MEKTLSTVLLFVTALSGLLAQDLQIHKTDGNIIIVTINKTDSIVFIDDGAIGHGEPCLDLPTITDIDGNVYNTVFIGTQCWMKENLRTTNFNNGVPIEYPGDNNESWANNISGAYAWYDNDMTWKDSYGALYNWYAVDSPNGLCPTGWHIPSNTEWTQLVTHAVTQGFLNLGITNSAGNAIKSCRQENSPLGGDCLTSQHPRWNAHEMHYGFDEFGFSGLPGGYRLINGSFSQIGINGAWWTSTEDSTSQAWSRYLFYNIGNLPRYFYSKNYGFSVRCVRD